MPRIDQRPVRSSQPVTRDNVSHCLPYYLAQDRILTLHTTHIPWLTANNNRLINFWRSSDSFQQKFCQNLLQDVVNPMIHSTCSVFLIVSKTSGPKDKKIVSWLHKQLLMPTIGELIELCIYKYLWELASTITDTQLRPLKK